MGLGHPMLNERTHSHRWPGKSCSVVTARTQTAGNRRNGAWTPSPPLNGYAYYILLGTGLDRGGVDEDLRRPEPNRYKPVIQNRVGGAQRSGVKPTEGEARGFSGCAGYRLTMVSAEPHTAAPGAV
jgi:hypothetical protein